MSKRRLLSSALLLSACGLFGEDAPDVSALPSPRPTPSTTPTAPPSDVPSAAPSEEPALISGLEEASALVCEVKNEPEGSHQYTAIDYALAEGRTTSTGIRTNAALRYETATP